MAEPLLQQDGLPFADVLGAEDIAELYGYRWHAELDIRQIKQTLDLDHVRCKSSEMTRPRRELCMT